MNTQTRLLPILLLFSFLVVNAQNTTDYDPKAKAILDGVSAKNETYSSVKIKFQYSMDNVKDDIHESQEGTLLLKGEQYKLELAGREIYCDGKSQWTYSPDDEEATISEPNYEEGTLSPTNIFTIYEKGFKYQYIKEEVKDGKTLQLIKLFPEDADSKPYHTIKLYIDKAKKQIHSITIVGKEGDDYTYKILKLTPNPATTPADFKFDKAKHPGVEVIDLRD
ncbi:outer membrane lipoprotein carrier protein LolA [Flavobacteriales bacterium AH-315-E23]|nr:outer membrane lipoprotein carrier protein LolA [Flavobacteriales bacterium AH-315-E23]